MGFASRARSMYPADVYVGFFDQFRNTPALWHGKALGPARPVRTVRRLLRSEASRIALCDVKLTRLSSMCPSRPQKDAKTASGWLLSARTPTRGGLSVQWQRPMAVPDTTETDISGGRVHVIWCGLPLACHPVSTPPLVTDSLNPSRSPIPDRRATHSVAPRCTKYYDGSAVAVGNGEDEGGAPTEADTSAVGSVDYSLCLSLSGLRMHEATDRGFVTLVRCRVRCVRLAVLCGAFASLVCHHYALDLALGIEQLTAFGDSFSAGPYPRRRDGSDLGRRSRRGRLGRGCRAAGRCRRGHRVVFPLYRARLRSQHKPEGSQVSSSHPPD